MSKKTFGRLILPVGGFDLVVYDRTEANPPTNECLGAEQYWNCRRVNKRNVVDAIVLGPFFEVMRQTDATTSKDNGNATMTVRPGRGFTGNVCDASYCMVAALYGAGTKRLQAAASWRVAARLGNSRERAPIARRSGRCVPKVGFVDYPWPQTTILDGLQRQGHYCVATPVATSCGLAKV